MSIIELFLIALGLSMDAFAVAVTNGMCIKRLRRREAFLIAAAFGVFQGLMPTIGYALGFAFTEYIKSVDHYIALVLLGIIGGKMLYEGITSHDSEKNCRIEPKLTLAVLLMQAVATSIDALAVGVSFAAMEVNIVTAALFIACITGICSFVGVYIGKRFGNIINNKAEILGGVVLILIGLKIFIEHMFF